MTLQGSTLSSPMWTTTTPAVGAHPPRRRIAPMLIRLYCLLHQALCPPGIDALRPFRGTRNRYAVAQRQQTSRVVRVDARVGIGGPEGVAQHLLYLLPLLDVQRPEAWVGRGPRGERGPYNPAGQVLIKHAGEQLEERLELFPRPLDGAGALGGELAELVTGGRHSRHQQFLLGSVMVLDSTDRHLGLGRDVAYGRRIGTVRGDEFHDGVENAFNRSSL